MVGHRLMEEVYVMWTVQWSNKVTLSHEDRHISNGSCVEYISLSGVRHIYWYRQQTNEQTRKENKSIITPKMPLDQTKRCQQQYYKRRVKALD